MENKKKYSTGKSISGDYIRMLTRCKSPFIFRGQSSFEWGLNPTFERACDEGDIDRIGWKDLENKIRIEFKRQAHHYLTRLPQSEFEWIALMQHYGAPTRLLDFTKSIWAALFFAVDGAKEDSALWAVDTSVFESNHNIYQQRKSIVSDYNEDLAQKVEKILNNDDYPEAGEEHADEWHVFMEKVESNDLEDRNAGVIFSEPFYMNQRLAIQQGVFAVPQDIFCSFECNMVYKVDINCKSFEDLSKVDGDTVIYKFIIPKEKHHSIIAALSQMNITAATFYPGLEGFARSQINHVRLKKYDNKKLEEAIEGSQGTEDFIKNLF